MLCIWMYCIFCDTYIWTESNKLMFLHVKCTWNIKQKKVIIRKGKDFKNADNPIIKEEILIFSF